MSDRFSPGAPEEDSAAWTGTSQTPGGTPARGDAAAAVAASTGSAAGAGSAAGPAGAAPGAPARQGAGGAFPGSAGAAPRAGTDGTPPSPYSPGAQGTSAEDQSDRTDRKASPRRREPKARGGRRRRETAPKGTGAGAGGASGAGAGAGAAGGTPSPSTSRNPVWGPPASTTGATPGSSRRKPRKASLRGGVGRSSRVPSAKASVWIILGVVILISLIRGCAEVVGNVGTSNTRGSGSAAAATPTPTPNTVAPTPAPSVSALRGIPYSGVPAPELVSQSALPVGTGYSPHSPAPGRESSVRLHDSYVGQALVLTFSPLGEDDSTVPDYFRDEFYPDEVWRSVRIHFAPEGYAEGQYVSEPRIRLQGESGRWYDGECFEYSFDDWQPTTRTFAFPVPEWDLPTHPVVEVDFHPYDRFSFPVYVDVG